jgi:hypothetical protein
MSAPLTAHAHSSEHNEHYTPEWIALRSHVVLQTAPGAVGMFDPMSSARANAVIRAEHFWTIEQWGSHPENVFHAPWNLRDGAGSILTTRIFCNPFGGKLDADTLAPLPRNEDGKQGGPGLSAAGVAFGKLSHEWYLGHVECALFLAFSLNVFRTAQSPKIREHFQHAAAPTAFPFMVFRDRIRFETIDPDTGARVTAGGGTPQDSAMVFLPPRSNETRGILDHCPRALARFRQQFEDQGHVTL